MSNTNWRRGQPRYQRILRKRPRAKMSRKKPPFRIILTRIPKKPRKNTSNRLNLRIRNVYGDVERSLLHSPNHKCSGYDKRCWLICKLYKNKGVILENHTKLLHIAQKFDILRNAGKKILKNWKKYTILISK